MDIDDNASGEDAMVNVLAETDKITADMTTDGNPMGTEAKAADEAKKAAEMNTNDNPTGKKANAAEASKKMTQKVADMKKRGGARAPTGAAPE